MYQHDTHHAPNCQPSHDPSLPRLSASGLSHPSCRWFSKACGITLPPSAGPFLVLHDRYDVPLQRGGRRTCRCQVEIALI